MKPPPHRPAHAAVVDLTIYVDEDADNPGFFVAYLEDAGADEDPLGQGKTPGMAAALALAELGRQGVEVERGLRARLPEARRLELGL